MRSEHIARYRMPARIHPMMSIPDYDLRFARRAEVRYAPDPQPYPYHWQRWSYPALGMEMVIVDRLLIEHYESRPNTEMSQEPQPDLSRLGWRNDLVLSPDGLDVISAMAPGVTPIPVSAIV